MSGNKPGDVGEPRRAKMTFELDSANGWPPVGAESIWVTYVDEDVVAIDNVPWFIKDIAVADRVRAQVDAAGNLTPGAKISWAGHRTIRVAPFAGSRFYGNLPALLDMFVPFGVTGEGIERFGLVALDVPPEAQTEKVKRLLARGFDEGWWDYEEGCIDDSWDALPMGPGNGPID
ncbi:DUF4265 domain-containing protein [Streptosporangiaceae bacterium NEAU-GS5]|nr:DUF4265 domain-containing protein [Streptosporangiaceae bacterium NEAU-GS5]